MSIITSLILRLIAVYQVVSQPFYKLKPFAGCRFYPSCSNYAQQALLKYGWQRGGWLFVKRIIKCHPYGAGGIDLVP